MSQTVTIPAPGSLMADIALIGPDGESSTLLDEIADAPAIIHFMRTSTCPACLAHSRVILRMIAKGDLAGHRFLLITPGEAEEAAQVVSSVRSPEASVWASGSSHRGVGLGRFLTVQHSGTFLVDADGVVRHARSSVLPAESFSADEILAVLTD